MFKKFALGLCITAFACASASAATLKYQEEGYSGSLEITQTSPENYTISLNTVDSNSYHTCDVEKRNCKLVDNNILICESVEGELTPIVAKLYVNGVKVISGDPSMICGMRGYFFGLYH